MPPLPHQVMEAQLDIMSEQQSLKDEVEPIVELSRALDAQLVRAYVCAYVCARVRVGEVGALERVCVCVCVGGGGGWGSSTHTLRTHMHVRALICTCTHMCTSVHAWMYLPSF